MYQELAPRGTSALSHCLPQKTAEHPFLETLSLEKELLGRLHVARPAGSPSGSRGNCAAFLPGLLGKSAFSRRTLPRGIGQLQDKAIGMIKTITKVKKKLK